MAIFKRLIGRLTQPKGLKRDITGKYWCRCHGIPDFDMETRSYFMEYSHPYQYQRWDQNSIGKWSPTKEWLGLLKPLI